MAYEPQAPYAIRQFELEPWIPLKIFGADVSFTNSASAMVVTTLAVAGFMILATRRTQVVPGRLQAAAEWVYDFVATTVVSAAGEAGRPHIPFVFTLFTFIFFGTLIGMTPVKFTFTSHVIVTLALAFVAFAYVISVALRQHGLRFFRTFLPAGTPLWLTPLIVVIEVISYLARPITLGVRLFANVLAGHMIIKLFGDFAAMMMDALGVGGLALVVFPVALMVVFFAFEVVVVLIQSYIFILLTSVYLRSSLEGH